MSLKIILIDDSLLDRKLLSRTLVNMGAKNEILQADNGEAGLGLIVQNLGQIGLVLLDYQMPKMTGLELMQGLVSVPATADLPIVMVTASASEESKQAAYAVNPKLAGYILKPYKPDQISLAVRPYLDLG